MCDVELKGQEEKREQEIEQAVGISRDVWGERLLHVITIGYYTQRSKTRCQGGEEVVRYK